MATDCVRGRPYDEAECVPAIALQVPVAGQGQRGVLPQPTCERDLPIDLFSLQPA